MKEISTKSEAIKLFGTQAELARALGCRSQAISQWEEELSRAQRDRVLGAAIRVGKLKPDEWAA